MVLEQDNECASAHNLENGKKEYLQKMALLQLHTFVFSCLLRGFWALMSLADYKGTQRGRLAAYIPYSGKLSREKTFADWRKYDIRGENFRGLLAFAAPKDATPPNFAEKTFANSHKTAKSAKVFSLESFPLYSF